MANAFAVELQEKLEKAFGGETAARRNIDASIAKLSVKLADKPDDEFLSAFAIEAAATLDAPFFTIARLNPFSNIMRSIRQVESGKIVANFSYSLDGTPCARAMEGNTCVYPSGVAEQFPRDEFLKDHKIMGYVGAPMSGSNGEPIGIIVALTKKPIEDEKLALKVFEHFHHRVARAMENLENLERYSWVIDEASDGVWDWDVVTGGTTITRGIQNILGFEQGKGPYDLNQIEKAIHPDDLSGHVNALKNHLNDGSPYDLKFRLRDRNGVYRWFRSRGKAVRNREGKPVRMIGSFTDIHDSVIAASRGQTPL